MKTMKYLSLTLTPYLPSHPLISPPSQPSACPDLFTPYFLPHLLTPLLVPYPLLTLISYLLFLPHLMNSQPPFLVSSLLYHIVIYFLTSLAFSHPFSTNILGFSPLYPLFPPLTLTLPCS